MSTFTTCPNADALTRFLVSIDEDRRTEEAISKIIETDPDFDPCDPKNMEEAFSELACANAGTVENQKWIDFCNMAREADYNGAMCLLVNFSEQYQMNRAALRLENDAKHARFERAVAELEARRVA